MGLNHSMLMAECYFLGGWRGEVFICFPSRLSCEFNEVFSPERRPQGSDFRQGFKDK